MNAEWTEAEIAAYVDGELEGADAARIAAALDADPEARVVADRIAATNALLRDAFAAPLDEPAPASMRAAVLGAPGKVVALPAARRGGQAPRAPWAPMALAASVALVVGVGLGGALDGPGGAPDGAAPALAVAVGPAPAPLARALDTLASGDAADRLAMLASFDTAAGLCREFETRDAGGLAQAVGLACREGGGWRVEMLAEAPGAAPAVEGFAPASGAGADVVGALLDALGAGPALSTGEEAERLAAPTR